MKLSNFIARLPKHEQEAIYNRARELIEDDCAIKILSDLLNRTPEQEESFYKEKKMNYDSKAWDWGKGFCHKHLGQDIPCQICIITLDKDLVRSDIIENAQEVLKMGDFLVTDNMTETEKLILLHWWTNTYPIILKKVISYNRSGMYSEFEIRIFRQNMIVPKTYTFDEKLKSKL